MKRIWQILKTIFWVIVFFGLAMTVIIAICGIAVYFTEMRWTIAFNITTFLITVLILTFGLAGKLATSYDSPKPPTKKQSVILEKAKAFYSYFF